MLILGNGALCQPIDSAKISRHTQHRRQRLIGAGLVLFDRIEARAGRGVQRILKAVADPGADRVQVDIGHRRQHGGLVKQCLALEARFPEMPLAAVFAIGPTVKLGQPLSLVFLAVSVLMVNQLF